MSRALRATAVAAAFTFASVSGAYAAKRLKKQDDAAPAQASADKRDRIVAAPGMPFNGRPYWLATAQCGGIYFKLNTIYADAAVTAKVVKPDPTAYARLSKNADSASTVATAYFDAAERFLIADRKVTREEAVAAYDTAGYNAGDKLKTADAALQAAKPCADLYKVCRGAFPQACADTTALTN